MMVHTQELWQSRLDVTLGIMFLSLIWLFYVSLQKSRTRVVRDHRTEATESSSATIRDHRTDPTRVTSATIRPLSGALASRGVMARRPMTPILAPAAAPRIAQASPVTRLIHSTYHFPTQVYQKTSAPASASQGESPCQPSASTVNTDVSILAFICRSLPQTPNPDPSLTW
jgi:hypothetical protein